MEEDKEPYENGIISPSSKRIDMAMIITANVIIIEMAIVYVGLYYFTDTDAAVSTLVALLALVLSYPVFRSLSKSEDPIEDGACPNPEETADKVLRHSRIYLAAVTVAMIAVAVAVAVYI